MKASVLGVIAVIAAFGAPVRAQPADAVAMLPLDADQRLEIYGRPVASEVAHALTQGGIEVVVVGPKMAVPDRAKLIVDGTIKPGKGDAVGLAVRLRDAATGKVLETLTVNAKELTAIDRAAADLSALVLPAVKKHLAALVDAKHEPAKPEARPPEPAAPPAVPAMLVAVTSTTPNQAYLREALGPAIATWSARHHHVATTTDMTHLARPVAAKAVAGANADLAIAFEILAYVTERDTIPFATARVRVRIADHEHVVFERVVVTDSIVGDKGMAPPALAARAAQTVLDIVEPHLRSAVATWKP